MSVRDILKMGDPRLLRLAQPVTEFDSDALHLPVSYTHLDVYKRQRQRRALAARGHGCHCRRAGTLVRHAGPT